tara:strand:+ start:12374 stop:12577 length:204 start_codon:yes stop_codon:yes gene_type:complete
MILDDNTQSSLRINNVIGENEVAIKLGDLFVAENILSKERRQLSSGDVSRYTSTVNESANKRGLLKD